MPSPLPDPASFHPVAPVSRDRTRAVLVPLIAAAWILASIVSYSTCAKVAHASPVETLRAYVERMVAHEAR